KQVIEGKSVIAVEHSKEIIKGADYIIELGPHAGKYGGELIFKGNQDQFKKAKTLTSKAIFSNKTIKKRKNIKKKSITIKKINKNNFKDFSFKFPLNSLVCVHGGIATGKSTILDYTYRSLYKGKNSWKIRLKKDSKDIIGKQNVRRTYIIDQTPIGNHPTSRPATYLNFDSSIRSLYSELPLSNKLKLSPKDFILTKDILENKKTFSNKILKVKFKGFNYSELLNLTVKELLEVFSDSPLIQRKLLFLQEVSLGYLTLGQTSKSLSGGEAQRIKIAKILTKKLGDRCIYIMDNPTKGLHLSDLAILLKIFNKIIEKNNTILIADNKEEIIANSDYIINLD
ncbi:MAG: ATP-binding cassette domain-containing protein, partial [Nanoarchaeota archaeon]|nr:ATP-binding cassette domain-containing protein [Nanoarchaeota archaeon]